MTCQVTSLLPVQLQKQAYGISQAPHIFEYLPFIYEPKCEAGVTYQVQISFDEMKSFEALPSWIKLDSM